MIGVLLIKGLKQVKFMCSYKSKDQREAVSILNKHLALGKDRDIQRAQEELFEAGLKEYARL
jgi:hypothetical protein